MNDSPDRHTRSTHKGWTAVTCHSVPWLLASEPNPYDDVWALYAPDDWTQARDLAAKEPEKLHELQRLFIFEATKYNVLPLEDRRSERLNADLAGYGPKESHFSGRVRWVQLDVDEAAEDSDHLISDEERLRVAMARQ